MDFDDHQPETSISDLPNDLIIPILTHAGCKSIVMSSSISKRMHAIHLSFAAITCFTAASSTLPHLDQAVKEAAARALEGMLGHVSFAILFTTNYAARKKDVSSTAELLSYCLPQGTPVVGAVSRGLMGIDEKGDPFEIDPKTRNQKGVSVLLGHIPGSIFRVFCDCGKAGDPIHSSLEQWTGLEDPNLIPVSCWLLAQGGRRADEISSALIEWMQRPEIKARGMLTIAGGEASGELHFHPGRQEVVDGWNPLNGTKQARYGGLIVLKKKDQQPLAPPRSTVLATSGWGPISSAAIWGGFTKLEVQHLKDERFEAILVSPIQLSSIRCLNGSQDGPTTASGFDFFYQTIQEANKCEHCGRPSVCLWSTGDHPSSALSMRDAIRSGLGIIGGLPEALDAGIGIFDLSDSETIKRIIDQGPDTLRYSLVWMTEEGVRGVLEADLVSAVESVTSKSNKLNKEILCIAARNAREAKAKGGSPTAMCLFSCTGRGKNIIISENGESKGVSEAAIADSCCDGNVPIIGCFLNGEIGPKIQAGFMGWASSESSVSLPEALGASSEMQGWTTMYCCIGT